MVEHPLGPMWKELQALLSVSADIAESPEPDAQHPITVTFTVANQAKPQADGPKVTFDDVELTISLGGEAETITIGRLEPGAVQVHTRACDYAGVKDVEASVQGTAAPISMFTVTNKVGASSEGLSPESFVTTVDRLDLRTRIGEALSAIEAPTADTTLSELAQARERINRSVLAMRDSTGRAESVYRLVRRRGIEQLHEYQRVLGDYVGEAERQLGGIQQELTKTGGRVQPLIDRAVQRLEARSQQVTQVAARLRKQLGMGPAHSD